MQEHDSPEVSFITSESQALQAMARATRSLGFSDASIAEDAQLSGIDIAGARCVARVRFSGQVNVSDAQRLVAVREIEPALQLLAFSASGFSEATLAFGQDHEVALFAYDPRGALTAHTETAHALLPVASPVEPASSVAPTPDLSPALHEPPNPVPAPPADPFVTANPPRKKRRTRRGWWWRWPLLALTSICGFGAFILGVGTIGEEGYWFGLAFYGIPFIAGTVILQWHRRTRVIQ